MSGDAKKAFEELHYVNVIMAENMTVGDDCTSIPNGVMKIIVEKLILAESGLTRHQPDAAEGKQIEGKALPAARVMP